MSGAGLVTGTVVTVTRDTGAMARSAAMAA